MQRRKKIYFISGLFFLLSILIFLFYLYKHCQNNSEIEFLPIEEDLIDEIQPLVGKGPHNEKPVSLSDLKMMLNSKDIELLREGNFKIAVCMHYLNNDWSSLQLQGIKDTLRKFGLDIFVVTDGEFDVDKQIADYENVMEINPDIIITIPIDTYKTAGILGKIKNKGIKLVFMDTVPDSFKYPEDYCGVVIADSYMNGRVSAEIIINHLKGKGKIALMNWKNKMFTVDQRSEAARLAFAKYPYIKVVHEAFFEGFYDIPELTSNILLQHPDLDAIWIAWGYPAIEVTKVIKKMQRDVVVTTVDMSMEVAYAIAKNDVLIGAGAQHPYDQGVAEALMALIALTGKKPPAYVAVNAEKVTRKSLIRAWNRVFRKRAPDDLKKILNKK